MSLARVYRSLSSAALICALNLDKGGHWSVKRTGLVQAGMAGTRAFHNCRRALGLEVEEYWERVASCSLCSLLPVPSEPPWDSLVAQMV